MCGVQGAGRREQKANVETRLRLPCVTSETKGPWWTAGLEPQRGRKTWSPARNSRVDLGGVKATEPVFLSLSLLFLSPNKLFKFFQQELQIMGGGGRIPILGVLSWREEHLNVT